MYIKFIYQLNKLLNFRSMTNYAKNNERHN